MSDLASKNDVATNGVNGRIGNKTWWKCEYCTPMETSIEGTCCLEMPDMPRFASSQDFQVHRGWSFVDQIHILCYDILGKKTLLVIWFPANTDFGKSE